MLDEIYNNFSIESAIKSLINGSFTKIICGAANTNAQQVQRLATVYSLAGVDVIDLSPNIEIYNAALSGINIAKEIYEKRYRLYPDFNIPVLMVSINSGNDKHFRKALLDISNCHKCFKCVDICPSSALYKKNSILNIKVESCYGCGRCVDLCKSSSIKLVDNNFSQIKDFEEQKVSLEAIEIHTGNNTVSQVEKYLESNSAFINNAKIISFSIESNYFSPIEIVNYARSLINLIDKKVIIQIDGSPMSSNNQNFSGVQSITYANILANTDLNAYIQIAGGANHLTRKYIDLFNIKIAGIGYGTFARKIILSNIDVLNDSDFYKSLKKSVNIATSLVKTSSNPVRNIV